MKGLVMIGMLVLTQAAFSQLIPLGSSWKFYDLGMEPPSQSGTFWKDISYNATSWQTGPAELGYGDGDESTLIASSTLTGYFRHAFSVPDPDDFSGLDLSLTYDDGAVIYLNGTEIWRVNMPSGTITYNTFASSNSSDNAQASLSVANSLITGNNILAVEVHQRSAGSSDISFNFSLTGLPAPGVAIITRGPYLQKANNNSLVVRWRTNIATPTMLDYGITVSSLTNTVSDMSPKTEHVMLINSLSTSTIYYYQIRNTTDTLLFPSPDVHFKTYPLSGAETPLTAWVLGDCGTGTNNARNVRDAYYNYIGSQHTDMILLLGDNAYTSGTDAEYQTAIFQNMYEQKLKNTITWSCLGNHDGISANSSTQTGPYYDIFSFPTAAECGGVASGTEAYYSFDFGNIHFISLDSYETNRAVGSPMYNWCENDLQNTMAKWIIALWHHPAYTKGSHDSDVGVESKQMRENFLPLFEDYGVDLVLSGHSHSYERSFLLNGHYGLSTTFNTSMHTVGVTGSGSGQIENNDAYYKAPVGAESGTGAVYVTTGSSGKIETGPLNHPAMYFDAATLGSCVLSIHQDTLSLIFLRQTGAVDDHFTLIKDDDCVPGAACNDNDPCTINDVLDNYCYCRGEADHRYVSNPNDAGTGSLREAVALACEGDTIHFTSAVSDTIRLNADINISKNLVLFASSAQNIVISGQNTTRLFYINASRQFTLANMTLFAGNEPVNGGALLNDGTLVLENVSFVRNRQGVIPKSWTNHSLVQVKQGINILRIE